MITTNASKPSTSSFSAKIAEVFGAILKLICVSSSFDYHRYRQLSLGHSKTLITTRGIAVLLPSIMIAGTLWMYGPAVFGKKETYLLVAILPLMVFAFDFTLVAHSYTGEQVPRAMRNMRWLLILVSVSLNVIVVAGVNSEALLPDIEKDLRLSPYFGSLNADLSAREKLNVAAQKKAQADVDETDAARKKLNRLTTLRDAEIAGATLSDGVQRVRGQGTKANGFILEMNEANQVAAGYDQAKENLLIANDEAESLKQDREAMESEIKAELKKKQNPGVMIAALIRKLLAGDTGVLLSVVTFLSVFIVIDCAAIGLAHATTPPELVRIAKLSASLDVAKLELDYEIALGEINAKRPQQDIKFSAGPRSRNRSANIFNMKAESAEAAHDAGEKESA